jgi:exosortase A-associated hydrolase 2
MVEEPFFFSNGNYRLFSVLHHPSDAKSPHSETGIIFCDPFAEEKLWAHRVFVNFARFLSRNSYWVFRFDCMGHGDSDGNYEDSNIETQISDIHQAVAVLKEKTGVKRVVLLGARFGGTLSALAGMRNDQVNELVLWNPVINGEKYFQECLRSNLTTQMSTYRKVIYTREQMVKDLLGGKPVNIDGYLISPECYKQISQIDLVKILKSSNKPFLMIQIHKEEKVKIDKEMQELYESLKEGGKPVQSDTVKGEPFWRELKVFAQREKNIFDKTLDWINQLQGRLS